MTELARAGGQPNIYDVRDYMPPPELAAYTIDVAIVNGLADNGAPYVQLAKTAFGGRADPPTPAVCAEFDEGLVEDVRFRGMRLDTTRWFKRYDYALEVPEGTLARASLESIVRRRARCGDAEKAACFERMHELADIIMDQIRKYNNAITWPQARALLWRSYASRVEVAAFRIFVANDSRFEPRPNDRFFVTKRQFEVAQDTSIGARTPERAQAAITTFISDVEYAGSGVFAARELRMSLLRSGIRLDAALLDEYLASLPGLRLGAGERYYIVEQHGSQTPVLDRTVEARIAELERKIVAARAGNEPLSDKPKPTRAVRQ
jgi:hypothetical protein